MPQQQITAAFMTSHTRSFILNDMGTGKTITALWAADWLMQQGVIRRALVITPLSTVNVVWREHILDHLIHRTATVLTGAAARRKRLLAEPHDFYIINHDGVQVINKILVERQDIDLVILDELAELRNSQTNRWEVINEAIRKRVWVWGLTGSPTPHSPTDAWAQIKLLKPENVPRYFSHFRNQVMIQRITHKWESRADALDIVYRAMQPSIRFTREQCITLPEATYVTREAQLTEIQARLYKELVRRYETEYAEHAITAANEGVKQLKLLQIICGAVFAKDGTLISIPCTPRLNLVIEIVSEAPSKVIVFAPFIGVIEIIRATLAQYYRVATVSGSTSIKKRTAIFHSFQEDDQYQVLVAHPKCMSHGLTLTQSATIVWYGPASAAVYEQANARITRPGQTRLQTIVMIVSTKLEDKIYRNLRANLSLQGVLLGMLQNKSLD